MLFPSVAEEIKESNNESSDSRTGCVHANVNGNLGCVPQIYYSNDRDKGYNDDDKFKLLKVNLNNVDYIPLGVAVHEINDPDNSVYPLDLMYYKLNTDEENALIKHLKKSEANTIIQAGIDEGQFGELTTQGEKLIIINSKVEFYDHNDNLIPTT